MFGPFEKKKKEEQQIVAKPPPRPIGIIPEIAAPSLRAYKELPGQLGFRPAQILEEQLISFLAEHKMPIYKYTEVDKYLAFLARQQKAIWIWRPLRERDKPRGWWWLGNVEEGENPYGKRHGGYEPRWEYRPYDKAVPINILRRVEKIQKRFGNDVLFFVSHYSGNEFDTFIMVTALDVSKIIFGVWNKSTFDEEGDAE